VERGLVNLNVARQRLVVLVGHKLDADLLHDPVRGLVAHAQLALKLLRRDAAASAGHDVHGVKPKMERGRGLLEDRPFHRMHVETAGVAGVGRSRLGAMEASWALALRAVGGMSIRCIPLAPEPI
jgi:hypothetical protein